MKFSQFLDESTLNESTYLTGDKLVKIGKAAFGALSVSSSTGRGKGHDMADVSKAKFVIDKMSKRELFKLLVIAGEEVGVELVPVDGSDANGYVSAGPGGEDCIMLKVKGNDFSSNDADGDFSADLVLALDQLTITSGI